MAERVPAHPGGLVQIRWESGIENLNEFKMGGNKTLKDVHARFHTQSKYPTYKFTYLCRGEPVPESWWDIFQVRHLLPVLYIRKMDSLSEMKAKRGGTAALLSAASNPYSKEHRKDTAQEKKDREDYLKAQESKKPKFRKPGQNFKKAKMGASKAQSKVMPAIRTGLVKKAGGAKSSGGGALEIEKQDGESEFAARARYFANESS
jgi:hypothetical protein